MGSLLPRRSDALPFPGGYVITLYSGGKIVDRWRSQSVNASILTQLQEAGGAFIKLGDGDDAIFVNGTFSIQPEALVGDED